MNKLFVCTNQNEDIKFYVLHTYVPSTRNWCSFSPDGLVTPSIGIPTKRMYSAAHYLSNKHVWTFVCLELRIHLNVAVLMLCDAQVCIINFSLCEQAWFASCAAWPKAIGCRSIKVSIGQGVPRSCAVLTEFLRSVCLKVNTELRSFQHVLLIICRTSRISSEHAMPHALLSVV